MKFKCVALTRISCHTAPVPRTAHGVRMQIYTKILIGMAVGAMLGVFAGPKSSFLDKDVYRYKASTEYSGRLTTRGANECNSDEVELKRSTPFANCRVVLDMPNGLTIDVTRESVQKDPGQGDVVLGTIALTDKLMLKAGGSLKARLSGLGLQAGDKLPVRFQLEKLTLPGETRMMPEPISGIGDTITATIKPIGTLFLRLIKMVIVPLVFASLLVGIASLGDLRKLGRIGGRTLAVYILTTAAAVTIGLLCAQIIRPGDAIGDADKAALEAQFKSAAGAKASNAAEAPSTIENILNIVPTNPMASLSSGDMLQVIFFALVLGIALTMIGGKKAEVVTTFFDCIQEAMVVIIHLVMQLAPYGVAALVADVIGSSGLSVLLALLVYAVTVLIGLFLHAFLVYGGLIRFVGKVKLGKFLTAIRPAQLIAFSTSSSSATLPVSMECAEENLGVSNSVSSFVLPLGSTVNMDGTALYQGVAAMFIAQVFVPGGIDLTDQLTIVLTATLASVGAAGVPGAGMVTLAMVLTAVGIPEVGIALILGMDRLLDMFRTAVNVTGDLAVTATMAVMEGEKINPLSPEEDRADPSRGFEGRVDHEPIPVVPDDSPR